MDQIYTPQTELSDFYAGLSLDNPEYNYFQVCNPKLSCRFDPNFLIDQGIFNPTTIKNCDEIRDNDDSGVKCYPRSTDEISSGWKSHSGKSGKSSKSSSKDWWSAAPTVSNAPSDSKEWAGWWSGKSGKSSKSTSTESSKSSKDWWSASPTVSNAPSTSSEPTSDKGWAPDWDSWKTGKSGKTASSKTSDDGDDDHEVCGIKIEQDGVTIEPHNYDSNCSSDDLGTNYTVQNFDSDEERKKADFFLLHEGHCGLCSTAQDLASYMKFSFPTSPTDPTLASLSIQCYLFAVASFQGQPIDPSRLVQAVSQCLQRGVPPIPSLLPDGIPSAGLSGVSRINNSCQNDLHNMLILFF